MRTHTCTTRVHTHKQDTFLVLFYNNIHLWEEGSHNGLDWYRLLAERCWKSHFRWRKQLDTKKRRTARKLATDGRTMRWPTNRDWALNSVSTGHSALKTLWFVTAGNSVVHLMAFHMSITLTLSRIYTVTIAWDKTHQLPVSHNRKVPISWSFTMGEKIKKSRENTSQKWQYLSHSCKQRSGRWMWQESNDINLNSYLHFYKRTLQQSSCRKSENYTPALHAYVTKLQRMLGVTGFSFVSCVCSDVSHLIA